jgi:hypothetical protein
MPVLTAGSSGLRVVYPINDTSATHTPQHS